jgi:hypothetical protein
MFKPLFRQTSRSDRGENLERGQTESDKDTTKNAEKWTLGVFALPIALLAFGFCAGATIRRVVEPAHNLTLVISPSDSKQGSPDLKEGCLRPIVELADQTGQAIGPHDLMPNSTTD